MSEIQKLETRIKNAERFNSTELRISVTDARNLLAEITSLQLPASVPLVTEVPIVTVSVDAGSFGHTS